MSLKCYVDESSDGLGNQVAVMAGYLAEEEVWNNFNKDWNEVLLKQKKKYFHSSAKIFSGSGSTKNAEMFYRVIEKHLEYAFCIIVDIASYRDVIKQFRFPDSFSHPQDIQRLRDPLCLMYQAFFELSLREQHKLGVEGQVQFIFDKTAKYQEMVSSGFNYMFYSASELGIGRDKFGEHPYFDDDKKIPALQAADLLTRLIRTAAEKGLTWTGSEMPWKKEKSVPCLICPLDEKYFLQRLKGSSSEKNMNIYDGYKPLAE
jgi:hypothetical protein